MKRANEMGTESTTTTAICVDSVMFVRVRELVSLHLCCRLQQGGCIFRGRRGEVFAFIRARAHGYCYGVLEKIKAAAKSWRSRSRRRKKKQPSKSLILIQKENERGYEQYSSVPLEPPARRRRRRRRNHFPH